MRQCIALSRTFSGTGFVSSQIFMAGAMHSVQDQTLFNELTVPGVHHSHCITFLF